MSRPHTERGLWVEIELTDGCVLTGVMSANLILAEPWKGIEVSLQRRKFGANHRHLCILRSVLRRVEVLGVMGGEKKRKAVA